MQHAANAAMRATILRDPSNPANPIEMDDGFTFRLKWDRGVPWSPMLTHDPILLKQICNKTGDPDIDETMWVLQTRVEMLLGLPVSHNLPNRGTNRMLCHPSERCTITSEQWQTFYRAYICFHEKNSPHRSPNCITDHPRFGPLSCTLSYLDRSQTGHQHLQYMDYTVTGRRMPHYMTLSGVYVKPLPFEAIASRLTAGPTSYRERMLIYNMSSGSPTDRMVPLHMTVTADVTCGSCSEPSLLGRHKHCSGCAAIFYCSNRCQQRHWDAHKAYCQWHKEHRLVNQTLAYGEYQAGQDSDG